jgi:hypothetical protein
MRTFLTFVLLGAPVVFGQGFAQIYDNQVNTIEREVLGLAQKMPADKYDFAPKTGSPPNGVFDGVRTFGQQVKHTATYMYMISSSVLNGEKPPVDIGTTDDGPENLRTKDQILEYFRGAIAFSHKAMQSLTVENAFQATPPPIARPQRLAAAAFLGMHSFDHYGQMVVYARMNGITPGPEPGAGKGKAKGKGK